MKISDKVWRKGWREEAAATLNYLEHDELSGVAAGLRELAMKAGVRQVEAMFSGAITAAQTTIRQSATSTNPTVR